MTAFRLLVAEIGYRRLNFALCVLAVLVAATLFVAGPTLISGYAADTDRRVDEQNRKSAARLAEIRTETDQQLKRLDDETRKAMRDLGFNLNIVHKDTNMSGLYMEYTVADMPEDYIQRLANAEQINMIRHLVASLQQKIKWNQRSVLLVGFLPEVHQSHMSEKAPMGYTIEPGTVFVGHELAAGLEEGDTIDVEGPGGTFPLQIAKILPEQGTQQDVTLAVHLHDAQKILGKEGKISQIMALGCHCKEAELPNIQRHLAEVLPDTRISEHVSRRIARAKQRDEVAAARAGVYENAEAEEQSQVEELKQHRLRVQGTLEAMVGAVTPLVVLVCAAFVGLMSWNNVRERWAEIGILRAIGKRNSMIAALLLGKALIVGLLGGTVGCLLGYWLAQVVGTTIQAPVESFRPGTTVIVATVLGAPLVAALSSYLPTLAAVRQDPAVVLQDQ